MIAGPIAWGGPADEAPAALAAALSAAGFPGCAVAARLASGGLAGLEAVVPPRDGAAALFEAVFVPWLAGEEEVGFTIRRAAKASVEASGPMWVGPKTLAIWLGGADQERVDAGTMRAEGLVARADGTMVHVWTPSLGLSAREPRYPHGCVVVALSPAADGEPAPTDLDPDDYVPPALHELRRRAEGDDLDAIHRLIALLLTGGDLPRDRDGAIRLAERALALGDRPMAFKLAVLLHNRWDTFGPPFPLYDPTEAELARAAALYAQAGDDGEPAALVRLAALQADPAEARRILERAAAMGSADAHLALSDLREAFADGLDPEALMDALREAGARARGHLETAARQGSARAAFQRSAQTRGTAAAAPWLELAAPADRGYDSNCAGHARCDLARLHDEGRLVPRDPALALRWWLIAAGIYNDAEEVVEAIARLRAELPADLAAEAEREAAAWLAAHPAPDNDIWPFDPPQAWET